VTVDDPLASMRRNMRAFYRLLGAFSPGGAVVERDGLVAAIVPSCPQQSVVNGVVYEGAHALRAIRDELEALYRGAGVRSWRVWVTDGDDDGPGVGEWLQSRGHRLSASPRAMTLDLADADFDVSGEPVLERSSDLGTVASLNERAYGQRPGEFAQALSALEQDEVRVYLARDAGQAAACVVTLDAEDDCGIYAVATRPASRRRGLATALMRRALTDARDRGCRSSSLQSSESGFSVYADLGYRDLCAIRVWEHRPAL
jgi:ribosomal protein S18 acetylase RimI-like enzyme